MSESYHVTVAATKEDDDHHDHDEDGDVL